MRGHFWTAPKKTATETIAGRRMQPVAVSACRPCARRPMARQIVIRGEQTFHDDRCSDAVRPFRCFHRHGHDRSPEERPAERLDAGHLADSCRPAAARRPCVHAPFRAGARGPRDARVLVLTDFHARRHQGNARGLHRCRRRHGRHRCRHFWRHSLRSDGEEGCGGTGDRWRCP